MWDNYEERQIEIAEIQNLLKLLAEHFTSKTKIQIVPYGTKRWRIRIPTKCSITDPITEYMNIKDIYISLIGFFGMYVGYNEELDLLVMWKP